MINQDISHAMSVIPLTVFFSLLLAGLFMVLFAHEQRRRRFASAEHDSLLPLADERSVPAGRTPARARADEVRPPQAGAARSDDDLYF